MTHPVKQILHTLWFKCTSTTSVLLPLWAQMTSIHCCPAPGAAHTNRDRPTWTLAIYHACSFSKFPTKSAFACTQQLSKAQLSVPPLASFPSSRKQIRNHALCCSTATRLNHHCNTKWPPGSLLWIQGLSCAMNYLGIFQFWAWGASPSLPPSQLPTTPGCTLVENKKRWDRYWTVWKGSSLGLHRWKPQVLKNTDKNPEILRKTVLSLLKEERIYWVSFAPKRTITF